MKDFFDRQGVELDIEDIARYAKIITDDLALIIKAKDFRLQLLDTPTWEKDMDPEVAEAVRINRPHYIEGSLTLDLPLVLRDKQLGVLSVELDEPFDAFGQKINIFKTVTRQSLEKILLYKINITDRETGLYNADYLKAFVKRDLTSLTPRSPVKPLSFGEAGYYEGLSLVILEIKGFSELAATHGWIEAGKIARTMAQSLEEAKPDQACLAVLIPGRFGLALPHVDIRESLKLCRNLESKLAEADISDSPRIEIAVGLSAFPKDFSDESSQIEKDQGLESDMAESLFTKAELALGHAADEKNAGIFTFEDVLKTGGRVVQVLPLNRVVVNLGHGAGARTGQVFTLGKAGASQEIDFKGEVVLYEVKPNFSVGEIINLPHSTSMVKTGDRLSFSQTNRKDLVVSADNKKLLDPLLNIADHQGFVRIFEEKAAQEETFAAALIKVDGYEQYRETRGRLSSDQQMKGLYELIKETMPEDAYAGRFAADSLILFIPGVGEKEILELAENWRAEITQTHPQTASFGLAVFPCASFSRANILINAQKAMEHAAFFGPSSLALFDSVSLNISADKLFEAGDQDGAIDEFNRALELNPNDINVLNSLGVCYGYMHQLEEAKGCFEKVLSQNPDNMMAYFNQGFAQYMSGNKKEALENFQKASELEPDNFDPLFQLGKTALELNLIEDARQALKKAAECANSRPVVHRYLGEVFLAENNTDKAVEALQAALRHNARDSISMSQLAALYMDRGTDLEVALSLAGQSVSIDPANPTFRERLARALVQTGELERALDEYKSAAEMGEDGREIYYNLGLVSNDLGQPEDAARWLKMALEKDPEYAPAAEALAALDISGPEEEGAETIKGTEG